MNISQLTTAVFSQSSSVSPFFLQMRSFGAFEAKCNVAIIGSVPKCVAHCEQNESISVIVPIKCPNIFCDLPLGMGVFQQAHLLRAKQAICDAHRGECNLKHTHTDRHTLCSIYIYVKWISALRFPPICPMLPQLSAFHLSFWPSHTLCMCASWQLEAGLIIFPNFLGLPVHLAPWMMFSCFYWKGVCRCVCVWVRKRIKCYRSSRVLVKTQRGGAHYIMYCSKMSVGQIWVGWSAGWMFF